MNNLAKIVIICAAIDPALPARLASLLPAAKPEHPLTRKDMDSIAKAEAKRAWRRAKAQARLRHA